jgi:hypothetical protein
VSKTGSPSVTDQRDLQRVRRRSTPSAKLWQAAFGLR